MELHHARTLDLRGVWPPRCAGYTRAAEDEQSGDRLGDRCNCERCSFVVPACENLRAPGYHRSVSGVDVVPVSVGDPVGIALGAQTAGEQVEPQDVLAFDSL